MQSSPFLRIIFAFFFGAALAGCTPSLQGVDSRALSQADTTAPDVPSALALASGVSTPSNDSAPSIEVSGVVAGDVVSLYSSPDCSDGTLRGYVTASGSTATISASPALEADGSYSF